MRTTAILIYCVALIFASCGSETTKTPQTTTSGSTEIVVDESLAPIVQDQWEVFSSTYPDAKIKFVYRPENLLLNRFLNDSSRIAVMARDLKESELKMYEKRNVVVRQNKFAIDAIALISNNKTADSTIEVKQIVEILEGKNANKQLVFDNANSSTVRYLKELANVRALPDKGVYALKSNSEVIEHVHNNAGAIGVIGVNWIKRPDAGLEPLIENIKILAVKNLPGKSGSDSYYKPTQNNLALGLYPLSRDLYIVNCQGGTGLGTGFAAFLASERGQAIVLKAGLLPSKLPTREILIKK